MKHRRNRAVGITLLLLLSTLAVFGIVAIRALSDLTSDFNDAARGAEREHRRDCTRGDRAIGSSPEVFGPSPGVVAIRDERACPGGKLAVTGYGFKSGATVTIEAESSGIVGEGKIDESGILFERVELAADSECYLPDPVILEVSVDNAVHLLRVPSPFC